MRLKATTFRDVNGFYAPTKKILLSRVLEIYPKKRRREPKTKTTKNEKTTAFQVHTFAVLQVATGLQVQKLHERHSELDFLRGVWKSLVDKP